MTRARRASLHSRPTTKVTKQSARDEDEERKKRAEAPTVPPPEQQQKAVPGKHSGVQGKQQRRLPAAKVDEVVADKRKDPRHEED
jgi:hypothetical protein